MDGRVPHTGWDCGGWTGWSMGWREWYITRELLELHTIEWYITRELLELHTIEWYIDFQFGEIR
jgi:hypothetical protein